MISHIGCFLLIWRNQKPVPAAFAQWDVKFKIMDKRMEKHQEAGPDSTAAEAVGQYPLGNKPQDLLESLPEAHIKTVITALAVGDIKCHHHVF